MSNHRVYVIIGAGILLGALAGWLIPGLLVPVDIALGAGVGVACGVGYQRGRRDMQKGLDADRSLDD